MLLRTWLKPLLAPFLACPLFAAAQPPARPALEPPVIAPADQPIHRAARALGRGINLGNALEAPVEGEWGLTLRAEHFERIRQVGFDSIRLPVRWSAHADAAPPYRLHETFARRVDWAVDQARRRDLVLILDLHHYDELFLDPDRHADRLVALWEQLARRYQDQPDTLYFEPLNEPHGALDADRWNALVLRLLAAIRPTNPDRPVLLGPVHWNDVDHLPEFKLPAGDRNLIVTIHYYRPFEFTHQGAHWIDGSNDWVGRPWGDDPADTQALDGDLARAAAWARAERRPLHLGEFGVYRAAASADRVRWSRTVARTAERHGLSWSYWQFSTDFPLFDQERNEWDRPLLDALLAPAPAR